VSRHHKSTQLACIVVLDGIEDGNLGYQQVPEDGC
jgi:hypothetical protein